MTTPVVWWSLVDGERPADKWDAHGVRRLIDDTIPDAEHADTLPERVGAVVVLPAGVHRDRAAEVNERLRRLPWLVLFLTADEGSLFPIDALDHGNAALWVMTPRPERTYPRGTRFIGHGVAPGTAAALAAMDGPPEQDLDWSFAGQVNHHRRTEALTAVESEQGLRCEVHRSPSFAAGMDPADYAALLARSRAVLAPSGPVTPDSFRAWEALEAGAVPLADGFCPECQSPGFWEMVAPGHPFPVVKHWRAGAGVARGVSSGWPWAQITASAWWTRHKAQLRRWLAADLRRVGAMAPDTDGVTVLMPTSACPVHPSTDMIERTLGAVREQLPDAEIVVMADGLRPELAHRADDYAAYLRRLVWLAHHRWRRVSVDVHDTMRHQSGMTARALADVATPFVLFVEHDMLVHGSIPWDRFRRLLSDGTADVIRLYQGTEIEPAHAHMMTGPQVPDPPGDFTQTVQWSQTPHLCRTSYYRSILADHFDPARPEFIEERMHAVLAGGWAEHGPEAWFRHRVWIFSPPGNMSRVTHLDGRAGDPPHLPGP